jgi:hypothetical protein
VAEAQDAETVALKHGIPGAVALEGRAVAVVAEAIRLHDQTPAAPEEVDFVRSDTQEYRPISIGLALPPLMVRS